MARKIAEIRRGKKVIEGAGVHLSRVFGFDDPARFDPFLLLDDFRSTDRNKYIKGFPWHPHRGIETITYMLQVMWNMATVWATPASSPPATCSG